jgi:hypothetical protein
MLSVSVCTKAITLSGFHCVELTNLIIESFSAIDAHREGGGGTSCTPSKEFQKLDHNNAIKHENRGPPPVFLTTPSTPPQKNLKMTVHLCFQLTKHEREVHGSEKLLICQFCQRRLRSRTELVEHLCAFHFHEVHLQNKIKLKNFSWENGKINNSLRNN